MTPGTQHAVVIGASMAGLLAAHALNDFFAEVTLVERDTFSALGEHRKGVPQSRHAHALLESGRAVLERFFPGLTAELVARGALLVDPAREVRRFIGGCYHREFGSGLESLYLSRPLLEGGVRSRVLALPNVRVTQNCDALGLASSEDRSRVTGVRIIRRADGSAEEVLTADLVVDASGRGSRSPAWLDALGYDKPEEEQVRIRGGYASRLYRREPEHLGGRVAALIAPVPPNRRMGVVVALENQRWLVSLVGYLGDHTPTDPAGFLAFAKTLPAPDIYDLIKDAEPLSEPVPATFPASTRRRYEKLKRFPQGYLVIGDAICAFNPTYGQGMSVAALEAALLQELLAKGPMRLSERFFRRASAIIDNPWQIAVGGDLRFEEVEGKRGPMSELINRYLASYHRAAQHDPALVLAFGRVSNLTAPASSLLHPKLVLRVLWGTWRPGGARGVAQPDSQEAVAQG